MSSQSSLTPVPPSVDGIAVPLPPMNAAQIPLPALPNTPASLADISSGAKFLNRLDENQSDRFAFEMLSLLNPFRTWDS
jgi:hypothetical protein